jgi:hypothetical protein
MTRGAFAFVFIALLHSPTPGAQTSEERRVGLDEQKVLDTIVEDAAVGKQVGGNAWLKWAPHFFRGTDGKTYVPFTLRIDEAPGGFARAAMYVRVAPRGDQGRATRRAEGIDNPVGIPAGEFPVNSPDRRQGVGAPTASDATLMLRSLTAKHPTVYPYEAMYSVRPTTDGSSGLVRRSLAVAPGDYDVYIALLEQGTRQKRWAVLKQQITVPNLTAGLKLSSIVVADRIDVLGAPVPQAEQALRPYALGAAELVPAGDDTFSTDETLHLAFLIYDALADESGRPDVRIEYRLLRLEAFSERLLGSTPPQALDRTTLPESFDLRAGHQLAATQSLPLASYSPASYRIVVRVIDNRRGATTEGEVRFVISG